MARPGWRTPLLLFAVGLAVYGATAGGRLRRQSSDPHFVYQAEAWLRGRVAIDPAPAKGDDWAKVETVELDDGSQVRGRRLSTRKTFRVAGGGELPVSRIARSVTTTHYVSFPPFPAVLMIPQVLIHGDIANDVGTTVVLAALVLPLCFVVLRRLAATGRSTRSAGDDLWLTVGFGFGTVFYFSAVLGRVWFTAHVVGVVLALGYALCALDARRPIAAGVLLGLAAVTRAPMAFMFPLFAFEAWRVAGGRADLRRLIGLGVRFAAPVVVIAAAAMAYNHARFGDPTEFGHSYLDVRQQAQMETYGLFSLHYLNRNLAVAFTLLPELLPRAPYLHVSYHGLAMWFTTPVLLLLLWPRVKGPLHSALWVTVAIIAVPALCYQNSGWRQFGYRFSLDYLPFLFLLLAIGGRPLGRLARGLIVAGILINLFGAITFDRMPRYYGGDYGTVLKH